VLTILFAFAELELTKITRNWNDAVTQAIEAGKYIAAKTPVGYVKGEDGRLLLDPEVAPKVREVFRRRTRGASWRELAEYLEEEGVRTAWGNDFWTTSSLRNVVMNRAYLGEARQGEIVNPEAHEPLVSEREWQAAQPGERIILRKEESRSAACVLRGLLVCGGCGKRMLVGSSSDHRGRRNPPHYYCRGHHSSGHCPARASARHTVIDPYVEERLVAAFAGEGPLAEALVRQDRLDEALRELEVARHTLALYVSNTTLIETIGIEMFTKGAEEHQRRVELAELAVAEARTAGDVFSTSIDGDLLCAWTGGGLTPLERRTIVAKMIDRVILHPSKRPGKRSGKDIGERVQIVLKGNELLASISETAGAVAVS
jgi:hypothetical protein